MEDGDWQLAPTKSAAKQIAQTPKFNSLLRNGITIHHKIAQTRLLDILKVNQKVRSKKLGAARFWKAVLHATKGMEGKEEKLILNIPANLEVGPKSVIDNPGSNFDGNTLPAFGGRGRRYSLRSERLSIIDQLFLENQADLTDEQWNEMAEALEKANLRHGLESLSDPLTEQWLPHHGGFRRQRTDEENARVAMAQSTCLLWEDNDFTQAYRGTRSDLEVFVITLQGGIQNPRIEPETIALAGQFANVDDVS